ncbi:MAG TPA: hypothetical protein VG142_14985 [Trebonia sp.]|jgi:hypothetical protein|nr:hypothetical protein [Trebonia sp.]
MTAILTDPEIPAHELRQRIYSGDLVILTRLRVLAEFVEYVRDELAALFAPHDPEYAHEHIEPAEMAKILGAWKPRWIHAERSRDLVRAIITEAGFEAERTHYDVPKPRTSFPAGHLTTGIAFAFPWHRDVWYSAPPQQVNWWLPIFPVRETNAMSFDLAKFGRPVPNTSGGFDYYENNAHRVITAKSVRTERQSRPGAVDHAPDLEMIPLPAPGEVLLFSGAQLHKSIPNVSGLARFSVDFRTVDTLDLQARRGAPLADVYCTGTAIRDFVSVKDESAFDEDLVRSLFGAPPEDAMLVFEASASASESPNRPER